MHMCGEIMIQEECTWMMCGKQDDVQKGTSTERCDQDLACYCLGCSVVCLYRCLLQHLFCISAHYLVWLLVLQHLFCISALSGVVACSREVLVYVQKLLLSNNIMFLVIRHHISFHQYVVLGLWFG